MDERAVPLDHPDSNFGMIERELLHGLQIPEDNVHRVHTELGAQAAAEEYESQLRKSFPAPGVPRFDVLLLGMGEDGHTASLFPGTEALHETSRLVLGYMVEKLNAPRITLTFPVINNARKVLFLVAGENKAATLRESLSGRESRAALPGRHGRPARRATLLAPRRRGGVADSRRRQRVIPAALHQRRCASRGADGTPSVTQRHRIYVVSGIPGPYLPNITHRSQ